jgi:hypothetical protein
MRTLAIHAQKHSFDARNAFNGRNSVLDGHLTLRITPMLIGIHHDANPIIIPFASTLYGESQGCRPTKPAAIFRPQ